MEQLCLPAFLLLPCNISIHFVQRKNLNREVTYQWLERGSIHWFSNGAQKLRFIYLFFIMAISEEYMCCFQLEV